MAPLLRDLGVAYAARCAGGEPGWVPLPVQYADYALWQRELLGGEEDPDSLVSRQLAYWRDALAGLPARTPLPVGRVSAEPSGRGETVTVWLDADVHRDLEGLARACGATLFMVFQAALGVLLCRLGGGGDIALGSAVSGRSDEAVDELVGFFVNTVVLRTDVSGDPTFEQLLARVRDTDLEVFAHQDVPFERVVEAVNPPRLPGVHPLFQVMYTLETAGPVQAGPDLDAVLEPVPVPEAKFDLHFGFATDTDPDGQPAGVDITVQFAADRFDAAVVRAVADRLIHLLSHLATHPGEPVTAAPVEPVAGAEPPPDAVTPGPAGTLVKRDPRTATEAALCRMYLDILDVGHVGIDDSFFDLGGHSMLAAQLAARIRRELDTELSIRTLFEAPTVAGLAARLNSEHAPGDALAVLLPMRTGGDATPLICVHPAAGISWVYAGLLRHLGGGRPLLGLQARGLTAPDLRPVSVADMVEDYLCEIRAVRPHGPYHLLGWSFGGVVAHSLAERLQREGERVASLTMFDSYPPDLDWKEPAMAYDDPAAAAEVTRSLGHAPDSPDSPLVGLDAAQREAMVKVFVDNRALMHAARPGVYTGDVLYFTALADKTPQSRIPVTWKPYVAGRILQHAVEVEHGEMTTPAALSEIGPVLDAWLRRTD
jgi:thioesterase domain-containing protein